MAKEIRLQKKTVLLLKVIVVLAALTVLVLCFLLWFKKKYRIDRKNDVTVTVIGGNNRYTKEEILNYTLDSWFEDYWILTKWYYKYRTVKPMPYLEKITISVTNNGKIEITAYEKVPIGCIKEMGYYIYFDSDGIVVSTNRENVENLPVITGLEYTKVTLYEKFETQKSDLYRVAMNIVHQIQKYEVDAEEIHFGEAEDVYLICRGNRFDLGTRDAYDVQIGMISGILNRVGNSDVKYHFHMENAETVENVYATVIE